MRIKRDELIENLGFLQKNIASEKENSLSLARKAVNKLMMKNLIHSKQIDYIIFSHSGICENGQVRSLSAKIQFQIKAKNAFCFEITNGCNSFNAALHLAESLLAVSKKTNILIVVSDTLSKYIDFSKKDVQHLYMYSDGAAAILVNNYNLSNKLISSALHTDGMYADISKIKYKISRLEKNLTMPFMDTTVSKKLSFKLYNTIVSNYIKVIENCIKDANLKISDIKFLYIAQNSKNVITKVLNHFNIDLSKTVPTGKYLGHVGALDSIIAFCETLKNGKLKSGDYIILAGVGVGFHWGAHLVKI